jgi:alanine racemase
VDLGMLRRNLHHLQSGLPGSVRLMAVIKMRPYGHGVLDLARVAVEEGACDFGLRTLKEAMHLRKTDEFHKSWAAAI